MQKMIDRIVEMEWTMFHNTKNIGGPASCQNDRSQFEIMRKAQFLTWNEELLRSYEQDLQLAVSNGQNLVTYKYAYMMEATSPLELQAFRSHLPAISDEKLANHEFAPSEFNFRVDNAWDIEVFVEEYIPQIESMGLTVMFDDGGWMEVVQGYRDAQKFVANLFEKHLKYGQKSDKPNKNQEKAMAKFEEFLKVEGDGDEKQ